MDELSKLQDEVPPAPWEDAEKVLESELGPVEDNFEEFDTDAISGASLGQVYDAKIDGERVAVKVRRPGIEELVEADLRVIRWSLPILMRFLGQGRAFSLENLADEFGRTIREEMDYGREASMLNEIRTNFEDDPDIDIPHVIESHSGSRVLTMEFLGGTKINRIDELDEEGFDRHELAETLQRAYLQMIIQDGVFHADPHPGNLAVADDGTIIFYDFGMSGNVDEFIQRKIVEFYIAVANQDIEGILDALIEMGTLSPEADRRTMGQVMELAIADARGEDIETYRVQQIVSQVEDTIYEFPLRLPSNLALVLRVATVVEGVCVTLDPDFDFIAVATEYLTEEGYREESIKQYVSETGDQLQASAQSLVRTPPKLETRAGQNRPRRPVRPRQHRGRQRRVRPAGETAHLRYPPRVRRVDHGGVVRRKSVPRRRRRRGDLAVHHPPALSLVPQAARDSDDAAVHAAELAGAGRGVGNETSYQINFTGLFVNLSIRIER